MWKYRHTALIIFALVLPCFGQDSGVFSNYFAVQQQGEWCHSGRIERCQAAGIAVTEPTFWDYLTGKNHAKLLNVKADIRACIPYYVKPVTNVLAVLESEGIAGLTFSNDAQFLTYCGLATNALDETPYFKSQYPSVTGGWQNVRVMMTNMLSSKIESSWVYDEFGFTLIGGYWDAYSFGLRYTFPQAQSNAVSDWGFADDTGIDPCRYTFGNVWVYPSPLTNTFLARAISAWALAGYWEITESIGKSSEIFAKCSDTVSDIGFGTNTYVFDNQGADVSTNWFLVGEINETYLGTTGLVIGAYSTMTNDPGFPTWCADPITSVYSNTLRGWSVPYDGQITILHWNGTNGFKYK
jgi:hypothetical protein